ncbi:hypothetical protein [Paenibacillus methanolicus]|uniref:N-acetyltransferase domain-containing protein n=1 Tax=Paenibacillus methanolicus TaxID=582686 RepID=A0A5S5CHW0_9BACL|nr:hypothetical protein [Paenibacillus methanolicus]TYP78198.1 hypothetical protein BCM02_102775 [Paenibacillus methanolicus]
MNLYKPREILERIEKVELELTKLNAARSLSAAPRRLEVRDSGDCKLLMDHGDKASPYYNRIKGFGPRRVAELDKLLAEYGEASPSFELTPDGMTESVARSLNERGYIPVQQLVYMYAETRDDADWHSEFEIERVTEETSEAFVGWIRESHGGGMVITQEMMARSKPYFHRPDFANYMLRIDGAAAAMGSMFIYGQSGYLANDYTFESYRGRGCQTSLIRRRLSDAMALGLDFVATDVEFGTASHGNMLKAGFKTAHLNTFWMKG